MRALFAADRAAAFFDRAYALADDERGRAEAKHGLADAYAQDLQLGIWTLDPEIAASFDPAQFLAWTPIDSLVIERFHAFALSYTVPFELDATELYQKLRTTYDAATGTTAAS